MGNQNLPVTVRSRALKSLCKLSLAVLISKRRFEYVEWSPLFQSIKLLMKLNLYHKKFPIKTFSNIKSFPVKRNSMKANIRVLWYIKSWMQATIKQTATKAAIKVQTPESTRACKIVRFIRYKKPSARKKLAPKGSRSLQKSRPSFLNGL